MPESRIPAAQVRRFLATSFERLGLPPADADTVAELMTEAELQGSDGHGVIRLVPYARRIKAGGLNLKPDIRVVKEKAAMALLDGDNGMGHLVMKKAAEIAIAKARQAAWRRVGARLSSHAGRPAIRAHVPRARHGGHVLRRGQRQPPAARQAGHAAVPNPSPWPCPPAKSPVVLDMATTVAAYGRSSAAAQRGGPCPWAG
jgi:LDH2 family malate/lactate/ureidoglycolate dehydrogenase